MLEKNQSNLQQTLQEQTQQRSLQRHPSWMIFMQIPLILFELAMALEEEFSVEIPSEDLEKITTVADAMNYLTEHQA